ncbi:hypothetical protein CerSpe_268340 [Prunus speciosa]
MAHHKRGQGGVQMEGRNTTDDMDEIKRMIQQLTDHVTRIETQSHGGESFDGEGDENPFYNNMPMEVVQRGRDHYGRNFDMKVDLPEFERKMQPDDFVDWLNTIERIFDYKEVPNEKKVKIVAIKLRRNAFAWWEQLKTWRDRIGKSKIKTKEKMKKELKRKFLPENYLQANFLKLHNLQQGNWTIEEYAEEFDLLTMRCKLIEEEEHTVACYLGGMRREIHDVVVLQQYWSYDVVFKLAIQLEKQMKTQSRRTGIEGSEQKNSWMTKDSSNSEPWKHEAPKTNAPENFTASKPKGIKCFKCSGIGHIASECPNRKIVSLVEELGET